MRRPSLFFAILFVLAVPVRAPGQEQCPAAPEDQRRLAEEIIRQPAAREFVPEGRSRVLHVYCTERDKESRRAVLVAVAYNYASNVAVRLVADPVSRQFVAGEKLNGRPQSSAEERDEAFRIVREKLGLQADAVLEGGFVVDPPENTPGRYLQVLVLGSDRWTLREFVVVELSRGVIAARRKP